MANRAEICNSEFDKIREHIQGFCTDEYYLSNGYLKRWLQYTNFDTKKAVIAFKKSLIWRKENRIDSILEEDFSDLESKFPIEMSEVDKEGRIVLKVFIQSFDCKNFLLSEQEKERKKRFAYWMFEKVEHRLKEQFYKTDGRVSQYVVVTDCSKLGDHVKDIGVRHLYKVITLIKDIISNAAANFPRGSDVIYIINASKLFTMFHAAVKQFLSKETEKHLYVYGCGHKFDWEAELFEV